MEIRKARTSIKQNDACSLDEEFHHSKQGLIEILHGEHKNHLNTKTPFHLLDKETSDVSTKTKEEKTEKLERLKTYLLFKKKEINIFKLYWHLATYEEKLILFFAIIVSFIVGAHISFINYVIAYALDEFGFVIKGQEKLENIVENEKKPRNVTFILGLIVYFARIINDTLWNYLSYKMSLRFKEKYLNLIFSQEQSFFDSVNTFELASKIQIQLKLIQPCLCVKVKAIILVITEIIVDFGVAFYICWYVALVILTIFPFILFFVFFFNYLIKKYTNISNNYWDLANGTVEEILYDIKAVCSFGNFEYEENKFGDLIEKVHTEEKKISLVKGLNNGITSFFVFLGIGYTMYYGAYLIGKGKFLKQKNRDLAMGDVFIIVGCIFYSADVIKSIPTILNELRQAVKMTSDYFTLLEKNNRQKEKDEKKLNPELSSVKGKIEFRDVCFSYKEGDKKILNHLNLKIEAGKKVAIVSESGEGKTTIVNLIERLYNPISGLILLDDININRYDDQCLRKILGLVPQEPILFNDTIKNNIIFGREELIKSLGDPSQLVKEACHYAGADTFIVKKKGLYNYNIGMKGGKLSGGEKQKISIARAIINTPKILLLDDAFSALDNISEKEVTEDIDKFVEDKKITSIYVGKCIKSMKKCDTIFVLKDGKILEHGTHEELMEKKGHYSKLARNLDKNNESIISLIKDSSKKLKTGSLWAKFKKGVLSFENGSLSKKLQQLVNLSKMSKAFNSDSSKNEETKEEKIKKTKIDYPKIFKLITNYKFSLIIGIIATVVEGGMEPLGRYTLFLAKSSMGTKEKAYGKGKYWLMNFIFVGILQFMSNFLSVWLMGCIGSIIRKKIRMKLFKKYLECDMEFFDDEESRPEVLLSKLNTDTEQLNSSILSIFTDLFYFVGVGLLAFVLSFILSWRLTLIVLCFYPFYIIINVYGMYKGRMAKIASLKSDVKARKLLSAAIRNTKTFFIFNYQYVVINEYLNLYRKNDMFNFIYNCILSSCISNIPCYLLYLILGTYFHFSAVFYKNGDETYSHISTNASLTVFSVVSLGKCLAGVNFYFLSKINYYNIDSVLKYQSKINPRQEYNQNLYNPEKINGKIEFRHVTFIYPKKYGHRILSDVNFIIKPQQSAAIVGFSGSGKTTIISLIERFFDPTEGQILIDDIDIKEYDLYNLRKKIGLVNQTPNLFKRSNYENVHYGNLEASEEDVFKCAEIAGVTDLLKDDIDDSSSKNHNKQNNISAGEKQRLVITRALLKDPKILLLDEATSALDKETEESFTKSLDKIKKGRTSISIAHRLNTIVKSDIIIYLEHGQVVEQGTHKELMNKKGKYASLYSNMEY